MTEIHLITKINATPEVVSMLSLDIGLHQQSMHKTAERAVDGVRSGQIKLGETVKWKGKHFGIWLTHKSRITELQHPDYFVDEMEEGHFAAFRHLHQFIEKSYGTMMVDRIVYETPYGFAGRCFDRFLLKAYLTKLIKTRNAVIRTMAEKGSQHSGK